MTTWTDAGQTETSWATKTINTNTSLIYDAPIAYDLDYITYEGYYIISETDWLGESAVETSWKEEL